LRGDEESILDLDYRRDGFDYANSYIAHFGKPSKFTPERKVQPTAVSSMEPFVLEMIANFAAHCKRVGALCVFTFPPQPSDLRAFDPTDAQALVAQMLAIPDLNVIDRPEDQIQPLSRFYDTTYHLTRDGAAQRTERVTTGVRRLLEKRQWRAALALDDVDFDGFDADALGLEPLDGVFDNGSLAVEFQTDDADFLGDADLAEVENDGVLLAQLPDNRTLDMLGWVHQPEPLLLLGVRGGLGKLRGGGFGWFFCGHD